MAFSDLCKISNAYKAVENEPDQSERIMEENSMVRDLITKILDETGPTEIPSLLQPSDKASGLNHPTSLQYQKNETNTFAPPYNYHDNMYNFNTQNDQNSFNFLPNGYGNNNGFNFNDSDVNSILGIDTIGDASNDAVTPEQLNLLRLAAQEIGGAQFTNPNAKFDYNYFETNQRNAMTDNNMFQNNFNRNSVNMENVGYNNTVLDPYQNNMQRYQNGHQESNDMINFLNPMNSDRSTENIMQNNMTDYNKMQIEMNGHYQNPEDERNKMYNYNRNYQQPKQFNNDNFYMNEVMKNINDKNNVNNYPNQKFEYNNQQHVPNFKSNGFHQMDGIQRRDMNQGPREFQGNMNEQRPNFDNQLSQQAVMIRQNQELARQMALLMRNRPPPNQLNVDVSFLHENAPFNLGLGALIGPSPPVPPPVLPSPMLDLPLLAPFYAMRNMRAGHSSSAILHARLDACYEQWRQLERERKRTEARLALAYPGRAVSSSNSIPVPRLPPCPTRVDRLTVDMLREHTKVLTLMGKMETLRASVCISQNKKCKSDESKITVLKRGKDKEDKAGIEPDKFDPSSWKDDVNNMAEIAPHAEIEAAMLSWRSAVGAVQAARRRELAHTHSHSDYSNNDPILQLAEAVKQLCISARRARCAMWCDLTLTVALAPNYTHQAEKSPSSSHGGQIKQTNQESPSSNAGSAKNTANNAQNNDKEEKQTADAHPKKQEHKTTETNNNKQQSTTTNNKDNKSPEQKNQRRTQNFNRHKLNQIGRNDFYQKNQRYDNRFMHNRHPYYLATGPIN